MKPACRICYGEEGELIDGLCNCKGSLAYVHACCMERWIRTSKSPVCNICNTPLVKSAEYEAPWMRFLDTPVFDHAFTIFVLVCAVVAFRWALAPSICADSHMLLYYSVELMSITFIMLYIAIWRLSSRYPDLEEMFPVLPLPNLNHVSNGAQLVYHYILLWVRHHKVNAIQTRIVFARSGKVVIPPKEQYTHGNS